MVKAVVERRGALAVRVLLLNINTIRNQRKRPKKLSHLRHLQQQHRDDITHPLHVPTALNPDQIAKPPQILLLVPPVVEEAKAGEGAGHVWGMCGSVKGMRRDCAGNARECAGDVRECAGNVWECGVHGREVWRNMNA